MTAPFEAAGAAAKPVRYAPIFTRRFWTGLYTNRNPLGDPVTPYIYDRFYNATRYDFLIDGHDCEITPSLTLARRPGHSVYNNQTFPPIDDFFEFRTFTTGTERIYVIADAAASVFDATGPSTKTTIYTKTGGAGQSFFQDVGNVLYWGDGAKEKKWLPALSSFNTFIKLLNPRTWPTAGAVAKNDMVIDTNGNIQVVITAGTTGGSQPSWNSSAFGTTTDNTATWRNHGPLVMKWGVVAPTAAPTVLPPTSPNIFAVRFWAPNHSYGAGATGKFCILDSNGNLQTLDDGTKTTGAAYPPWNTQFGGKTTDGTATWTNHGQMISATVAYKNSAAYVLGSALIDTNGNIQIVTTAGTTAAGPGMPTWGTGAGTTTADGTLTWTCFDTASICAGGVPSSGSINVTFSGGPAMGGGPPTTTTIVNTSATPTTTATPRGYIYYQAFFTASGEFSNLSPASLATGPVFGAVFSALVSGDGSSDSQVMQTVLFRTTDGGVTPFAKISDSSAVENSNAAWGPVTDTTLDKDLDTTVIGEFTRNAPPPSGLVNLVFHLGRIWGSVGNVVYFSNPANLTIGVGWESWSSLNSYTFPSLVTRVHPTALGMMVITVSDTYIIPINQFTGLPSPSPFPYIPGTGMMSFNCLAVNGSLIFILGSSGNLLGLDPSSGVTYAGHPIADKLKLFDRSASYLTWHEEGEDVGLYVTDGVSQRYRLASTSAPETSPPPWSPVCNLACKAVRSIEVLPGVHRLLIGPSSNGPILQRDQSVNTDNGVTFGWSATIGTLVLAQPGQLAEVAFITTIGRRVGSHPTLGVLVDEISGTFESLFFNSQDSPYKFASSTLMMDRFNMNQTNQPAKMMFLQLQITYPAENARNELLAYSLFGAHYQEK